MAKEILDNEVFDGTLNPGESTTITVQTQRAETIGVFADGGATGVEPGLFDFVVNVQHTDVTGEPETRHDNVDRTILSSYQTFAHGQFMNFVFENAEDTAQNFRFIVKSYRELR